MIMEKDTEEHLPIKIYRYGRSPIYRYRRSLIGIRVHLSIQEIADRYRNAFYTDRDHSVQKYTDYSTYVLIPQGVYAKLLVFDQYFKISNVGYESVHEGGTNT